MKRIVLAIAVLLLAVSCIYAADVYTLVVTKGLDCGGGNFAYTIQFNSKEECEEARVKINGWCKEIYCIKGGYDAKASVR